ncbi:hypothetical protein A2U01_0095738, partial [Trifolium medium]|nr:hypothetical protein [Trifolium medium]
GIQTDAAAERGSSDTPNVAIDSQ